MGETLDLVAFENQYMRIPNLIVKYHTCFLQNIERWLSKWNKESVFLAPDRGGVMVLGSESLTDRVSLIHGWIKYPLPIIRSAAGYQ